MQAKLKVAYQNGQQLQVFLPKLALSASSDEAVEANLLQLARNSAIEAGGDSVVKGTSPEYGKRTFSIYKCKP